MPVPNKDPVSWLNAQLFKKALVQHTADRNLVVGDIHLALHGNAAQQYASTIYRATVSYRSRGKAESIKLIVKLLTSKSNSVADEASYEMELGVYRHILPKMETSFSETETTKFAPNLIYASTEPQPHIVLEDLTAHPYEHHPKLLGTEDAKVVLIKLAQFHATSYSIGNGGPDQAGSNGLFRQKPSEGMKFMLENFSIFTEEAAHWSGFEKHAERLRSLHSSFIDRGVRIYEGTEVGFGTKVLNHGDFHYNNMLFKLDNDRHRVEDVIFYDFQLSCWTSPAVDLLYFLYLVCDRETRDTKRAELVQLYHQQFTSTLASLGHMRTGPTLLEINGDLLRAGFLELVIAVCFLPFLFADYNQAINVYGNEEDARAYRRKLYQHQEFRAIIEPLLSTFLYKGFLG